MSNPHKITHWNKWQIYWYEHHFYWKIIWQIGKYFKKNHFSRKECVGPKAEATKTEKERCLVSHSKKEETQMIDKHNKDTAEYKNNNT